MLWKKERPESVPQADGDPRDRNQSSVPVAADAERLGAIYDELELRTGNLELELERIDRKLELLTLAVAEGIERVDRSERRIKDTVRRAQKKLAEAGYADAALEAEASQLRELDGGGGDQGELQTVQPDLEANPDEQWSSVPGVTVDQLQQARGW